MIFTRARSNVKRIAAEPNHGSAAILILGASAFLVFHSLRTYRAPAHPPSRSSLATADGSVSRPYHFHLPPILASIALPKNDPRGLPGSSPWVTTTNGTNNAIVWVVGSEGGDQRLHGYNGDTGAVIYAGGVPNELMARGKNGFAQELGTKSDYDSADQVNDETRMMKRRAL